MFLLFVTSLDDILIYVKTGVYSVMSNPMDCSLPGSSVHGIFQAIVLEWIAISFPSDGTQVSCIVDRRFTVWATREVQHTQK